MKWIAVSIMALFFLSACTTNTNKADMPNPASVFCEENGGTLTIKTEEAGQKGICTLSDGTECDEWEYYRGECGPADIGVPNPASVYCQQQGGTLEMSEEEGGTRGICTLPDGTVCDEWEYYRGECPAKAIPKPATCGECPQLAPISPAFCKNGKVISGETDDCGCTIAPKCIDTFEECAEEGMPIMESYPRKCTIAGKTFTEIIEHVCTAEESTATACTADYSPVCGKLILNVGETTYQTYSNGCMACSAMKVVSYTPGECPA